MLGPLNGDWSSDVCSSDLTISSAIKLELLLYELIKSAPNKKGKKKDPLLPKKVFEW
jgi:hypothetical protein